MSGSAGGSFSKTKSSASQDVWDTQGKALKGMYGRLGGLFDQTNQQMALQRPGATQQAVQIANSTNPAWMQQLMGGWNNDAMALQTRLGNSLDQSLANPSQMQNLQGMIMGGQGNNYADAMKGQYVKDANQSYENMMSNLDSRAAASGMSGGSRHGVATAQGMRDINKNLQRNMAETGYNTFDKDLNRKLAIAQQADQGTLARQQLMSGMINNNLASQNQAQQGAINAGTQMQNLGMGRYAPTQMPWQMAGQYGQSIGDPTVLSKSDSSGLSMSASASGGM